MPTVVDILEQRVVAAAELIGELRAKAVRLEWDLARSLERAPEQPGQTPPAPPSAALVEELERLRAERAVIRESVRALIAEIDRVPW